MKTSQLINQQKDLVIANLRQLRDLGGISQSGFAYLSGKVFDTMQAENSPEKPQIRPSHANGYPSGLDHPQTGNTTNKEGEKLFNDSFFIATKKTFPGIKVVEQ